MVREFSSNMLGWFDVYESGRGWKVKVQDQTDESGGGSQSRREETHEY